MPALRINGLKALFSTLDSKYNASGRDGDLSIWNFRNIMNSSGSYLHPACIAYLLYKDALLVRDLILPTCDAYLDFATVDEINRNSSESGYISEPTSATDSAIKKPEMKQTAPGKPPLAKTSKNPGVIDMTNASGFIQKSNAVLEEMSLTQQYSTFVEAKKTEVELKIKRLHARLEVIKSM